MQWAKHFIRLNTLFLFIAFVVSPINAQDRVEQPVTLEFARWLSNFPQYRDQLALDFDVHQNLFLTLFRYDMEAREVSPLLAESYSVSEDGLVYTIKLRPDVQWVHYTNGEVIPVRPVTAEDAAVALNLRCRSIDGSLEVYRVIEGCDGSQRASGIQVVDDSTITIQLQEPASYLPSALTEPRTAPIPAELAEQATFYAPENIVTNGYFVVQSFKEETKPTFVFVRNPLLPEDMRGRGNIERVIIWLYDGQDWFERSAEFAQSGTTAFPLPIGATQEEVSQFYSGARVIDYLKNVKVAVFNPDKPPFDNAQVRRAFSAAIDRTKLVEVSDYGQPVAHQFGPTDVFGSLPLQNEITLGFDPEYAAAELAQAGYPNCAGLPTISIKMAEESRQDEQNVETLITQFNQVLGCDSDIFEVSAVTFDELYRTVQGDALSRYLPGQVPDPSNAERPNIWFFNPFDFIPDQAGYSGLFLNCERSFWDVPCTSAQTLIDLANAEQNLDARISFWRDVEFTFFGRGGEFPVAPLFFISRNVVIMPWIDGNPLTFYGSTGNWRDLIVDNELWMRTRNLSLDIPESLEIVNPGERVTSTISEAMPAIAYSIASGEENEISIGVLPSEGSSLDPMISVFDSNGNLIAVGDDVDPSSRQVRVDGLPGNAELSIIVYAFNRESVGDFVLRVTGGELVGTIAGDSNVNIRSGPGTSFGIVTALAPETEIQITGRNHDASWLVIQTDEIEGWIASFLVSSEGDFLALPLVE